jgi:hypothetical protein
MGCGFGWVEWNGIRYEHDIVIHANGSVTKRDKKKSKKLKGDSVHTPLSEKELVFLGKEKPVVVYIGTGISGPLPLTRRAKEYLNSWHTVILPTPDLLRHLESDPRRYTAVIHVTC